MSKKCPNCNNDLPDEASFCMHCFTKITPERAIECEEKNNRKNIFLISAICVIVLVVALLVGIFISQQGNNKTPVDSDPSTTQGTQSSSQTQKITSTSTTQESTANQTTTTQENTTTPIAESTTSATTEAAQSTKTENATQPSGTLKYSGYGNGIIITSYSGNESTVIIPDKIDGKSVLAVGTKAFSNNKYIKTITFEEGASPKSINIKPAAFYSLNSLTRLNLPSQVEADNFTNCLSGCTALQSINISKKFNNGEYYSSEGIVYKNNSTTAALVLYPAGKKKTSFSIPYKVSKINAHAFHGNAYLNKIKFSKREKLDVKWSGLFSKSNLKSLEVIEIYAGTDADIIGIQYFDGEILYYD